MRKKMGRKGKWYVTVKNIFGSESKEKKDQVRILHFFFFHLLQYLKLEGM